MARVVGVKFGEGGKLYYFSPGEFEIHGGDAVIVETARGIELGTAAFGVMELEEEKLFRPLKNVIRLATEEDLAHSEENRQKEKEAFKVCAEKIKTHGLLMKLINVEYAYDGSKIIFYFTADGRVDFRELVKDLASVFHTRIELRQVGVRDETRLLGGLGICGRPFCCHTYLNDFVPVSIKMAKEQNLSLNPSKISGVCGRLMCCLKNEEETYEYLNSLLPSVGETVQTDDGQKGDVSSVNVLRQTVKVLILSEDGEKEMREYKVDQLKFRPKKRRLEDSDAAEDAGEMGEFETEKKETEKRVKKPRQEKQEAFAQGNGERPRKKPFGQKNGAEKKGFSPNGLPPKPDAKKTDGPRQYRPKFDHRRADSQRGGQEE